MEKLKNTTIAAIAAGVIAVAGVGAGLGITQPWKQNEEPTEPEPPAQTEVQEPSTDQSGYFLTIGGKQVPSLLHEGDGWSILYPESWELAEGNENYLHLQPEKGVYGSKAELRVGPGSLTTGPKTVSCYRDEGEYEKIGRVFYPGDNEKQIEINCSAPAEEWDDYKHAFAAVARSFTMNGEQPFANWSPLPEEPYWQKAEGVTVLWLDKDGFVLDEPAQKAVESAMKGWDADYKAHFTGKYRIDDFEWKASFTNLECSPLVEVFGAKVWYELADGAQAPEEGGVQATVNGWYSNSANDVELAILHDGSAVQKVLTENYGLGGYVGQNYAEFLNRMANQ